MILHYIPGGCSLASHITLNELGLTHSLVSVGIDLPPSLAAYRTRLRQRPSFAQTLAEEGLS